MRNGILSKEDYEEPCCPLAPPKKVTAIPTSRVIEKLDEYLHKNDYVSAERHLRYWLSEAEAGADMRGKLTVLNEQIGIYRKTGKEKECLAAIKSALELAAQINLDNTVTMGTTLVNAATGYKAFDRASQALPLYQRARVIYEENLQQFDPRLGGLYNNMALTLMALGNFEDAKELFEKALDIMSHKEHGETDMAITYCNLADLACAKYGIEEGEKIITACLENAERLLKTESLPHDGYYAFVCEKCAPTFGYYGFFMAEKEFSELSREIYERA